VAAYTLVQLVEVLVFGAVLLFGVLVRSPSIAILGGGFLIGKGVLNILAGRRGARYYRRSVIGYAFGRHLRRHAASSRPTPHVACLHAADRSPTSSA